MRTFERINKVRTLSHVSYNIDHDPLSPPPLPKQKVEMKRRCLLIIPKQRIKTAKEKKYDGLVPPLHSFFYSLGML
jgi:hypothetical protein